MNHVDLCLPCRKFWSTWLLGDINSLFELHFVVLHGINEGCNSYEKLLELTGLPHRILLDTIVELIQRNLILVNFRTGSISLAPSANRFMDGRDEEIFQAPSQLRPTSVPLVQDLFTGTIFLWDEVQELVGNIKEIEGARLLPRSDDIVPVFKLTASDFSEVFKRWRISNNIESKIQIIAIGKEQSNINDVYIILDAQELQIAQRHFLVYIFSDLPLDPKSRIQNRTAEHLEFIHYSDSEIEDLTEPIVLDQPQKINLKYSSDIYTPDGICSYVLDEEVTNLNSLLNYLTSIPMFIAKTSLIVNQNHQDVLRKCFETAQRLIMIGSGFVSKSVLELLDEDIRKALLRGIDIFLLWGVDDSFDLNNWLESFHDLSLNDAETDILELGRIYAVKPVKGFHGKICICDNKFCVITSYNFLSTMEPSKDINIGIQIDSTGFTRRLLDELSRHFPFTMGKEKLKEHLDSLSKKFSVLIEENDRYLNTVGEQIVKCWNEKLYGGSTPENNIADIDPQKNEGLELLSKLHKDLYHFLLSYFDEVSENEAFIVPIIGNTNRWLLFDLAFDAQENLLIASDRFTLEAIGTSIPKKISELTSKGVVTRLIWGRHGMPKNDLTRARVATENILKQCESKNLLQINKKPFNNHSKGFLKDRKVGLVTSYNLLSAREDASGNEIGALFHSKQLCMKIEEIYKNWIEGQERYPNEK